jgi:hypothetical protein
MTAHLWWYPAHGGCGVATLREATGIGTEASHWPRAGVIVVVARTSARGLLAAQRVAVEHGGGGQLEALVMVADAPGRLPRQLEDLGRLVSGGYRNVYRVPWVHEWRLGSTPRPATAPAVVRQLAQELAFAVTEHPKVIDPFPQRGDETVTTAPDLRCSAAVLSNHN